MQFAPIQVSNQEVLIPLNYFGNATELELVVQGEFARVRAKPKATLPPRKPGSAIGLIEVTPDFFDPLPDELLDLFEA